MPLEARRDSVFIGTYSGSTELLNKPAKQNVGLEALDNIYAIVLEINRTPMYALIAAGIDEEIRLAVIRMLRQRSPNITMDVATTLNEKILGVAYQQRQHRPR